MYLVRKNKWLANFSIFWCSTHFSRYFFFSQKHKSWLKTTFSKSTNLKLCFKFYHYIFFVQYLVWNRPYCCIFLLSDILQIFIVSNPRALVLRTSTFFCRGMLRVTLSSISVLGKFMCTTYLQRNSVTFKCQIPVNWWILLKH